MYDFVHALLLVTYSLSLSLSLSLPEQFVMIICLKMKNYSTDFEKTTGPMKNLPIQQLLQRASEYTAGKLILCTV